jgi:MSHA biogenesis protein MshQ
LFSFGSYAASYSLPADIGTGAFSNCSGGGGVFNCTGDLRLRNNDSVILTGDVTLNISGNLDLRNNVSLDNNGFVFDINVVGIVDIRVNNIIIADISAGGDFTIDTNATFTGNISSGGNIDIKKNGVFTGDVTAAGTLDIDTGTVVNGICTPFHPQCTGGGSPPLDHFNINVGAGAANTCNPFSFTVTAEDSSNNPVTDYTGTVSLTTSSSNGNFSAVVATNNVNPNPDNDDNGSAGYTFDLLDTGSVTLAIANDHAETLTLSVSDASVPVTTISSNITFSDNAFTIIDNDLLVAGDNVPVAGRDHSYQIQMIRRDPIVGCGVATGYTGLKPLKMWRTKNASDPSPNDPALAGSSLPAADPIVNNGNITFVNGVVDVTLATIDIGKFTIELADISNTFADITIAGTSAEQTVRPFGLAMTNIIAGATLNPGADTPVGGIFTSAGSDFSATASSVLWDAGDDLDNDGILDSGIYANNVIAPSYAWDTTLSVSPIGFEPAAGTPGILINGGILQTEFSAGSFTPSDLQYTEVGSFTLQAAANDFLGESTADLVGDDIIVGRFTPASLLISATIDGMLANTCAIYTYIGESFTYDVIHPSFEVSAMNGLTVPGVTLNYTGIWAKLDDTSITLTNPTSDGTQLGSDSLTLMALSYTQDAGLYNITDNADGTFNFEFANDQFIYDRDANSEISPFSSDIDLIITDVTDLDAVTNTGTFTLQPLPMESRFGRIKMGNVHGSELIDLAMPMLVEYLNPAGLYVVNTDDNCTVVTTADLAITDNLSVPGSSTVTVTNPLALAADLGVGLTAPGAGVDGNIIVSPGLTGVADWLQYDWDSVGVGLFDDDPSAIATFGIYTGNDVNIYKLQIYQ